MIFFYAILIILIAVLINYGRMIAWRREIRDATAISIIFYGFLIQ